MAVEKGLEAARSYLEYFRDMGVQDFYRNGEPMEQPHAELPSDSAAEAHEPAKLTPPQTLTPTPTRGDMSRTNSTPDLLRSVISSPVQPNTTSAFLQPPPAPLTSLHKLAPLPLSPVEPAARPAALQAIRDHIGDCTRCPLAYAGRRSIVFGDGDPNARLMFVGEGPGADEDTTGVPFVGKAGQLLNNMIAAMGLKREQVYIANIVKCRPPANRVPEPVEANSCTQFLVRQVDVVQPQIIVALGATAAMYLLGVKQSLASLRGQWFESRGAKVLVTYHPAFLLRDPRQKAEAWKDLQQVMAEMRTNG
jgi:DNA polymerase